MSDIAIYANGLGKRYRIGALTRQTTMRERLTHAMKAPVRWLGPSRNGSCRSPRDFWALRGVSFEMRKGEVVGLIGRNGAGKSTLLKILARVTQPTEGHAEIHGRVGSLLEVGTGFHPELTGFENIYLSGALLGMRKAEIDRNLDEIVAFAVGDLSFQRKCLNKMEDVSQHGRTILFVSHNMQAITRLCGRAILISHGGLQQDGPASETAGSYLLQSSSTPAERSWSDPMAAPGNDVVRLRRVRIRDEAGASLDAI